VDTDDDEYCLSNIFNTYYVDEDGDDLGGALANDYLCSDDADASWELNNNDNDDACTSNLYADYCVDSDGDDHADAITATDICTDHAGSYFASGDDCAVDTDDDEYCLSNTFNTYYVDEDLDDLGGALANDYLCSDDADASWELNNNDNDDACNSNEYQDWCADTDEDGQGGALTNDDLCTDDTGDEGSVTNCTDADDACTANDYQDWYTDTDEDGQGSD
ncbi:uncharacterized protein METZ01_LOCUS274329, partial [marine metagenome]